MTPTETKEITRQKSVIDLDSMTEVTLYKKGEFTPVTGNTPEEVLSQLLNRLGNNFGRFVEVVTEGLESEVGRAMMDDSSVPFLVENEDGELVPFTGITADPVLVNPLILQIARSTFGYPSGQKGPGIKEKKQAAKAAAIGLIKSVPELLEGLKANAAAKN